MLMFMLVGVAALCYWPGLNGPFIFDDYATLPRLAKYGDIRGLDTLIVFLAGDITGAGGRPLSLLSFVLNSTTWPADPWGFKFTNVLLHLIIGGLLFTFCRQLLRHAGASADKAVWVAALATGFWLLNPFNVSTVLYAIQRMALLSAFFMLAGLVVYLHGRSLLGARHGRGYAWMTAAVVLFTPLAVFSKENGALLPLLILVLECTVLRHGQAQSDAPSSGKYGSVALQARPSRTWSGIFLGVPSLAVLATLVYFGRPEAFGGRDFTLAERLLTESRVLFDYLWHWFNAFAAPRGVLADDYPVSRGLFSPWTTFPAAVGVIGLGAWAVLQRRRHPLAALAILFYLIGHLMESTVLPLEIYFEHRSYLPAMLLTLPIAAWAVNQTSRARGVVILAALVLLAMSWQTYRLARIWGSDLALAKWSTLASPDSVRAIDNMAAVLSGHGRSDLAVDVLADGIRRHPEFTHFQLHMLWEKCAAGGISGADWNRVTSYFVRYPIQTRSFSLLANLVSMAASSQCAGLDVAHMLQLVRLLVKHPVTQADPEMLWRLRHSEGELLVTSGLPSEAIAAFSASMKLRPNIGVGLQQVALLASRGYFREGLNWLDQVQRIQSPRGMGLKTIHRFYAEGIPHLRLTLQDDLARQGDKPALPQRDKENP